MAKFLDKTGLDTLWAKIKSTFQTLGNLVTAWGSTPSDDKYPSEKLVKTQQDEIIKKAYGAQGFISSSAANAEIFAERTLMGSWSLNNRNGSVRVRLYRYADGNEDNATLVWDSNTATGDVKESFLNAKQTGTLLTTDPGECAKVVYTGSTSSYFRAIGIYLNVKVADGSHTVSANLRIGTTNYPTYSVSTWGSLVTAIASDGATTSATVLFRPNQSTGQMRFYGFRCLNTYSEGGTLIGTADTSLKLKTSRKLAISLSNTSTDTAFDGSADVTNIKTTGTLPVPNGGTGATSKEGAQYNIDNILATELTETPSDEYRIPFCRTVPSASNGVFAGYRKCSTFWNYIKDKISSVLGLTATDYGGNAATATTAATALAAATGSALETAINGKVSNVGYDSVDKKLIETINGASSDIVSVSTLMADMVGSVANGDTGFPTGDAVYDALVANGKGAVIIDTTATSSDIDDILTDGRLPVLRNTAPASAGYYQLMTVNSGAYVFGRCFEDYIYTWTLAAGTWTQSGVQLAPKTNGSTPGSSLFYREDGTWAAPLPRKVIESTDYCLVGTLSSTAANVRYAGAVFSVLSRDSQDRNKAGFLYIKKGRWTSDSSESNTCFSKFVCMSATVAGTVNFVKFYQVSSSNNEIQVWAQNNSAAPLMVTLLDPGNLSFTVGTTSQDTLPTGAVEISQYMPAMRDITSGFATVGSANVPVYVNLNGVITACGAVKQAYHHTIRNVYDNTVSTNVKCDLNDRKYDDEGKYTVCVFNNSSTYATYHAPESGWMQVDTEYHPGNSNFATQVARLYTGNIWYRAKNNNSWGTWKKLNS